MDFNIQNFEKLTLLQNNVKMLANITSSLIPISSFIGIDEGSTYCPFHRDEKHKSAKVYEDVDGVSRLFCFGQCQSQYTSYDYIKKILKKNVFNFLIEQFSQYRLIELIDNYKENRTSDTYKTDFINQKYIESNGDISLFIDKVYLDI